VNWKGPVGRGVGLGSFIFIIFLCFFLDCLLIADTDARNGGLEP
jgi:hypothetical protein